MGQAANVLAFSEALAEGQSDLLPAVAAFRSVLSSAADKDADWMDAYQQVGAIKMGYLVGDPTRVTRSMGRARTGHGTRNGLRGCRAISWTTSGLKLPSCIHGGGAGGRARGPGCV